MTFNLAVLMALVVFASGCSFIYLLIREEGRFKPDQQANDREPFRCPICAYIYVFDKGEELSTCPRCSTINKRGDS